MDFVNNNYLVDNNKTFKELVALNNVKEQEMKDYLCRNNLLMCFINKKIDNQCLKSIIRNKLSFKSDEDLFESVKLINSKFYCTLTKVPYTRFLRFVFDQRPELLNHLINEYTTWELSDNLGCSQVLVRRICSERHIQIPHRNSSKIHLNLKPYIENLIGYKTDTERYIKIGNKKRFIDEYCEELKLCIEIDGVWCHDEDEDELKDSELESIGYKVVRVKIPKNTTNEDFKESLIEAFEGYIALSEHELSNLNIDLFADKKKQKRKKTIVKPKNRAVKRNKENKSRKMGELCQECGAKLGHKKTCSKYKPPKRKPCPHCGNIGTHSGDCPKMKHLICPECGGKNGCHRNGCSKKKYIVCPECGGKNNNHKSSCSKHIVCEECGGIGGHHHKGCSSFRYTNNR